MGTDLLAIFRVNTGPGSREVDTGASMEEGSLEARIARIAGLPLKVPSKISMADQLLEGTTEGFTGIKMGTTETGCSYFPFNI